MTDALFHLHPLKGYSADEILREIRDFLCGLAYSRKQFQAVLP